MADPRTPRRRFAAFLTGQVDEEIPEAAKPPPQRPSATDAPLIPADAPRRPATRVARPAKAAPPSAPPVATGPDGEPVPIIALPDYAAPPGAVVSAGFDANGTEYVFEDDPGATPLVDPRYDADDRNWVRYRTSWGGLLRIVGLVFLVFVVVVGIRNRAYGWIDDQVNAGGDHGEVVPFTIPAGFAVNDIATELADKGIINNATVFRYWLRCDVPNGGQITITGFLGCDTEVQFQAGDYDLIENMTYQEVVDELAKGPKEIVIFKVGIPEGLRIDQYVARLLSENDLFDEQQLLDALNPVLNPGLTSEYLRDGMELFFPYEGLLFPATYDIPEQDLTNEVQFVARLSAEFDRRFGNLIEELGFPAEFEELGLDAYDIVIIASLIEEEAKLDPDRAKISRVIYNRLLKPEQLGIDATSCYAPSLADPEFSCADLTNAQLDDPNPWNTRAIAGLPQTPISAPGEASLRAALAPDLGDWFFYVLTSDDGSHTFSVTLAEHDAAVKVCVAKNLGCG